MRINVVLDIDGVLTCTSAGNIETAQFFKNKGAVFTAIKTHYIFPGVIEFIKLLFDTEGVRVSFFSSGDENRNTIFVKKILKIALGKNRYEEVKETVTVLSRNHLTQCKKDWQEHYRLYGLRTGKKQKDLSKILKEEEQLENTILIEDDSSFVACGQAKNFLFLPSTEEKHFQRLLAKSETYQPNGYKYLSCVFSCESKYFHIEAVREGRHIHLTRSNDQFFLYFLDRDMALRSKAITGVLIKKLTKIYEKNLEKGKNTYFLKDQDLVKDICMLVGSFGGVFQKICRSPNRIYYVTGLFFTALEKAKQESLSLSESLFKLQFKPDNDTYSCNYNTLLKTDDLYTLGLEKLKQYNNDLCLINPLNYSEFTKLNIPQEERLLLQNFIMNEATECCIM